MVAEHSGERTPPFLIYLGRREVNQIVDLHSDSIHMPSFAHFSPQRYVSSMSWWCSWPSKWTTRKTESRCIDKFSTNIKILLGIRNIEVQSIKYIPCHGQTFKCHTSHICILWELNVLKYLFTPLFLIRLQPILISLFDIEQRCDIWKARTKIAHVCIHSHGISRNHGKQDNYFKFCVI